MSNFDLTNPETLKEALAGRPLRTREGVKAYLLSDERIQLTALGISNVTSTFPLKAF